MTQMIKVSLPLATKDRIYKSKKSSAWTAWTSAVTQKMITSIVGGTTSPATAKRHFGGITTEDLTQIVWYRAADCDQAPWYRKQCYKYFFYQ
jgi:hypothetical protein